MNDNLRKLQLVEINILKQLLSIFEKHNITYYMLGGTLLGAIRHRGFIPWDDDMDIGLPRPDYERFLLIAEQEIKAPLQLHTLKNKNGKYAYYYARVEDTSLKVQRYMPAKTVIIPAWIDVFPLDGVPTDAKDFERWCRRFNKNKMLFGLSQFEYKFSLTSTYRTHQKAALFIKKAIYYTKIYKLINPEWAWNRLDRTLKSVDYSSSERLINACGHWGLKEMFPKSVYGKGHLYQFEDLMLNGPEDYDYVLKQMYGDYMTPPPEDQREQHHIEIIQS